LRLWILDVQSAGRDLLLDCVHDSIRSILDVSLRCIRIQQIAESLFFLGDDYERLRDGLVSVMVDLTQMSGGSLCLLCDLHRGGDVVVDDGGFLNGSDRRRVYLMRASDWNYGDWQRNG
jgi:hypothetical protein